MNMKSILFGALILNVAVAYGQTEKPVDSKITAVTVFLSKAQVTRELKTRIDAGKSTLVLTGLTATLDPQSIQAAGKGSFIILGISQRQNFLSELNMPKALRALKDSLDYYNKQLILEQSQKEILNKEEQMLLANQRIGGNNQNITVAELKGMADFYRTRLTDIVNTRMKEDEKIKKISASIVKLNRQVAEQNELHSRNTGEILINVSAEAATQADIEVNYVVSQAGWTPMYDLRAINTKNPVQLGYKANVFQGTGEEWKNVKLKLSTANPNQSGLKPELYTWYLDFYQPAISAREKKKAMYRSAPAAAPEAEMKIAEEADVLMAPAESVADYVNTIQTTLNTEFDIALPYTVASSNKPTVVDIRNYEMKSTYEYAVAPKLDTEAFLLAKGTGWEEFSLLPGEANIFFEGTFVGNSYIDPNNIKDTLAISLGRDKRIVVKREKLKDLTSRKVIGGSQRENYTWEITVRNTKSENVKITIEDQIPVSQNTQIEIATTDLGGAKYDANTGKLSWILNLQPNETKKLTYKFEVKYPKDRQVIGL
jgi:uncharacterized protein (TIGR02231 family)